MILLLLAACPRSEPVLVLDADPAALLGRARAEAPPGPVYAPFSAVVTTRDSKFNASGTLLVVAPDRLRLELKGPIGPPQVVVACDGERVRAYVAPKNLFVEAHADDDLGRLLGVDGVDGAALATSLLLGRVPAMGAEPTLSSRPPGLAWTRPDGAAFSLVLDAATAHLAAARAVGPAGEVLLDATWVPGAFPEALDLALPSLSTAASVKFGAWGAAAPSDAAFVLTAPEGAEVRGLGEAP